MAEPLAAARGGSAVAQGRRAGDGARRALSERECSGEARARGEGGRAVRNERGRPFSSEEEDALAGGLGVEEAVCLLGLIQVEPVGEDLLERNLAVRDEARALPLARGAEGPRRHQRELLPDHVAA